MGRGKSLAIALISGAVLASAPVASFSQTSGVEVAGQLPVFAPSRTTTAGANGALLFDRSRRIGYQIFALQSGATQIVSFDLDTFEKRQTKDFTVVFSFPRIAGIAGEFSASLDEDSGHIYAAYQALGLFGGIISIDGPTLTEVGRFKREDAPPSPAAAENVCTSQTCLPSPAGIAPSLSGLEITPARLTGSNAKLLLLMQEPKPPGSENNFNIAWIAQWDTKTGTQDWIYRIAGCSNSDFPSHPQSKYRLEIFQSRRGSAIYVGCTGAGGTGQVVRLLTGDGGRPIVEEVFPGPLSVGDILADPESDRMLMRVLNEEGESWWAFDGSTSAYVGVVGVTLSPVSSFAGVDRATGRLYVVAPPSSGGRQSSAGGFLYSDIRRSPVPQATAIEQFQSSGVIRIQADAGEGDRPTRVFVRRTGDAFFTVYNDLNEVSEDPALEDQDRFTVDEIEEAGKTNANFTGTGHSYGLRALFVGGLEGVTPGGPSLSGIRPGRYGPAALGSPCGKNDREFVFGLVRQAALSNDLASAAAISVDADASTKTDLAEIVSRCFPRPQQPAGADPLRSVWPRPFVDRDGNGRNDLDELVGQAWPTTQAECANDGEKTTTTKNLSGYDASVVCAQSKTPSHVLASARSDNIETPEFKIGSTYSSVSLTKDPTRGLVVRSESYVRGIDIPDVMKIEFAGIVAESFAAGRSGTAGTTFTRVLCGIEIPSQDVFVQACILPDSAASPQIQSALGNNPLESTINRALSGRGRISFPTPDALLSRGSPGGYLASIQKDRGQEISSRAINNDSSTQVPAIELVFFNDDPLLGRARQIYQFAGVDTSSTYGIFLLESLGLDEFSSDPGSFTSSFDINLPELLSNIVNGPLPPAPREKVDTGPAGNAVAAAAKAFGYGLGFLLQNPREAALAAAVWLLLAAPIYLALRKRALAAGLGV